MFYFLVIIVFLFIFVIARNDKRKSAQFLAITLIMFLVTIVSMMLYLSKDTDYKNVINQYFSLPRNVWVFLAALPISRIMIIRIMNGSSLLVIYFCIRYSMSYQIEENKAVRKFLKKVPFYFLFQMVYFDPYVQKFLYFCLYPDVLLSKETSTLLGTVHTVTMVINFILVWGSIGYLFFGSRNVHMAQYVRSYAMGEKISFLMIMVAYQLLFWFAPISLVKVSKTADYLFFRRVPLCKIMLVYHMYPYYLFFTAICICICGYKTVQIRSRIEKNAFTLEKQIDASNTTSKVFCHYMKNELLAIQSELELLDTTPDNEKEVKEIIDRCDNLYDRLDEIHQSTKKSALVLSQHDLTKVMHSVLDHMKFELDGCEVIEDYSEVSPVLLDENYFEQAINNIIVNSLDAMKNTGRKPQMKVEIISIDNMVLLMISDNGVGISEANISSIFTPFFSSSPITKHWGIGLSLTYKIITAHGGKIEVESKVGEGTEFRILLPSVIS